MKLLLAVSVLVIALSVMIESTSAQEVTDAPSTPIRTQFENIGTKIRDAASTAVEKSKATYDQLKNSEIVRKTQNWFNDKWQSLKDKVSN